MKIISKPNVLQTTQFDADIIRNIQNILDQHQNDQSADQALKHIEQQFDHLDAINNLIADCTRTQADILNDRQHNINDFQLHQDQIAMMEPDVYYVQVIPHQNLIQGIDDQIFNNPHPTMQIIDFATLTHLLNHYGHCDQF